MKNFTNYITIDKNGKVRDIINTQDQNFLAVYANAVRWGWKIIKGEQNEGYLPLLARLGLQ